MKTGAQAYSTWFLVYVPADSPGIEMYKINNMGRMGISTCIIRYNNVEIPEENLKYNGGIKDC